MLRDKDIKKNNCLSIITRNADVEVLTCLLIKNKINKLIGLIDAISFFLTNLNYNMQGSRIIYAVTVFKLIKEDVNL